MPMIAGSLKKSKGWNRWLMDPMKKPFISVLGVVVVVVFLFKLLGFPILPSSKPTNGSSATLVSYSYFEKDDIQVGKFVNGSLVGCQISHRSWPCWTGANTCSLPSLLGIG